MKSVKLGQKDTILGVSNLNRPMEWRLGLVRKGGGSEGRPAARACAASASPGNPLKFAGRPADAEGVRPPRFDGPSRPGSLRASLLPCLAAAAGLAGCQGMNLPPSPPPPTHEWVDIEHTTSARALASELGLRPRSEPSLHSLILEGEDGRIVFMDATRTIVVGGRSVAASKDLAIAGLDLPLRKADADRVKAAWHAFLREQDRASEVVSAPPPPPAAGPAPRKAMPTGISAAWKVPLKRKWKGILIHHSAQPSGNMALIDKVHRQDKGWLGIGYDFLIDNGDGGLDGLVETTFRWKQQIQGAHAGEGLKEYNDHWVGVCLVGNFNESKPTRKQMDSLKKLIGFLQAYCDIPEENIKFHRDIRNTDCPGDHFPARDILRNAPRAK